MKITRLDVHKCFIVFGGFLCYFLADGCTYSFSVIYSQALTYFGESKYQTAWMNALLYSVPQLLSPLVCSIGVAFGTATLAYLGSVFLFFALISTAYSTAIWQVYLSIALLLGFGLESAYVAALFSVSNAFTTRRGAAIGLATCGSGLGGLSMSTLTTFLFRQYEWKETCTVLGACFLNLAVAASLFRLYYIDLKRAKTGNDKSAKQISKVDSQLVAANENNNVVLKHIVTTDALNDPQAKDTKKNAVVLQSSVYAQSSTSFGVESQSSLLPKSNSSSRSCAKFQQDLRASGRKFAQKSKLFARDFASSLRALFRKDLYTSNLNFLLLCMVTFSVGFCVVSPLTYLYSHVELSLTPLCGLPDSGRLLELGKNGAQLRNDCTDLVYQKATLILWVMSLSTCGGVLLLGPLSDRVNAVAIHLSAMTIVGGCTMTMGLLELNNDTYPILLFVVALFGVSYGASFSVAFVLLIQFNGLDRFSASLSIALLNSGLANLSGTPIGGLMFDLYGSYNPAFRLSSCVLLGTLVLVVCLHLLLRFVVRTRYNMSLSVQQLETTISEPAKDVAKPASKSTAEGDLPTQDYYSEML